MVYRACGVVYNYHCGVSYHCNVFAKGAMLATPATGAVTMNKKNPPAIEITSGLRTSLGGNKMVIERERVVVKG